MDRMTDCRVRAYAKQCLCTDPGPLPFNRAILAYWDNLESIISFMCPSKSDMVRPTQQTSTGHGCSHQLGHPSQEFQISSARPSISDLSMSC